MNDDVMAAALTLILSKLARIQAQNDAVLEAQIEFLKVVSPNTAPAFEKELRAKFAKRYEAAVEESVAQFERLRTKSTG